MVQGTIGLAFGHAFQKLQSALAGKIILESHSPPTTHHFPLHSLASGRDEEEGALCGLATHRRSRLSSQGLPSIIPHLRSSCVLPPRWAPLSSAGHTQRQHPHRHKHTHSLHSCRGAPHVVLPCTLHIGSCFLLGASSRCVTHISCQHRHYMNMCR